MATVLDSTAVRERRSILSNMETTGHMWLLLHKDYIHLGYYKCEVLKSPLKVGCIRMAWMGFFFNPDFQGHSNLIYSDYHRPEVGPGNLYLNR